MLSLTRPSHSRATAKPHPNVARALLLAKESFLMVALFLILACWVYPVFRALEAVYGFQPSFLVRFSLIGFVFLVIGHMCHWILIHTSDALPTDQDGRPVVVQHSDNIDPNLEFLSAGRWRAYFVAHHGCFGGWTIALSITVVYSLVISQLAIWRLLLEAQDQTPMNKTAHAALIGTLVFMALHLVQACYSMSKAMAGAIGQLKTPPEHRTEHRVWSGLWHAGSYLV